MSRLAGAILAVRQAIVAASDPRKRGHGYALEQVGEDDDLIDDLCLCPIELESLGLILEETFQGISVDPETLWRGAWHRTPEALAQWCIRQSDLAAEVELRRQRRA